MSWIAVGAAVASAVVSAYSASRTAKKQDREVARGIAEQARLQREANARLNKQLDELETSTPEEEFATRSGQVRKQLRQKQALALAGLQGTGGGEALEEMISDAAPQAVGYGDDINRWLSGIAAPGLQRQGEAFDFADTASYLDTLRRHSAQEDYLTRLRLAGIRPSPWLDMLASGLSAYATSGFGGGKTIAGTGGGQPLPNLGGQTAQTFYSNPAPLLPGMSPNYGGIYGTPGKFGIFRGGTTRLPTGS